MCMLTVTAFVAALGTMGTVSAQQGPYCFENDPNKGIEATWHCFSQYEVGQGDLLTVRADDPTFPGDGSLDVGGVIYDGCKSDAHANNGGDPHRDWPICDPTVNTVNESVYIDDDVFGHPRDNPTQAVGGFYCTDTNNDSICGDPAAPFSETAVVFCGHADGILVGNVTETFALVYFVDGPVFQNLDCANDNPIGGTTGTVSIWVSPVV